MKLLSKENRTSPKALLQPSVDANLLLLLFYQESLGGEALTCQPHSANLVGLQTVSYPKLPYDSVDYNFMVNFKHTRILPTFALLIPSPP